MKRIAVIGSGISGLTAAYLLSRRHEVTLYERERRLGGHTYTVAAVTAAGQVALDMGFLVHNDRTYPNLVRLFKDIGVATAPSDMSFSVACAATGFEYSSRGARGFFADHRSLASRAHFGLLRDILRFHREAPEVLANELPGATIGDYLRERRYGETFVSRYLLPMASAIWSASVERIDRFPLTTMIRFMDNHGMLAVGGHPPWRVVAGGSATYIPGLIAPYRHRVHLGVSLAGIRRGPSSVTLTFVDRPPAEVDEVVLACHGDQVLPLLTDPTDAEHDVFAAFTTTPNDAWLHTDGRLLPRRPWARASWNYRLGPAQAPPTVTYHLNRLQGIDGTTDYCVTLNPRTPIAPDRVITRVAFRHPLYSTAAIDAQRRWGSVSGVRRTHYCGAYWRYGFHEDGVVSAVRVAHALGVVW
jgi:predicted NAD/FAD-binding protein